MNTMTLPSFMCESYPLTHIQHGARKTLGPDHGNEWLVAAHCLK